MKNLKKVFASILTLTLATGTLAFGSSLTFAESNELTAKAAISIDPYDEFPDDLPTSGTATTYSNIENGAYVETGKYYEVNWTFSNGYLTISPAENYIDGYAVSNVNSFFTDAEKYIKHVTISGNASTIYGCTFQDMVNLESVYIPNTVTYIGNSAFYNCTSLKNINIPSNLKYIDGYAFHNCTSLKEIITPFSMENIGYAAFAYSGIEKAIVSARVIEGCAFCDCNNLKSIEFARGVESIGNEVSEYCQELESIIISDTVKSIGTFAFYDTPKLKSVTIGNGLTVIPNYCFTYRSESKQEKLSVTLGKNIKEIGEYCFQGRNGLTEIVFPDGLTTIKNGAFSECNLTEIVFPDGLTTIENRVFENCDFTEITIPDSVTTIEYAAFSGCKNLTTINILGSSTSIGNWTFANCTNLKTINIPNSVASIGEYAFAYAKNINLFFSDNAPSFVDKSFSDSKLTVYYPIGNKTWDSVITNNYGGNVTYIPYTPLKIAKQTANVAAPKDSQARVSLTATGDELTYKWYFKNPGATKFSHTSTFTSNSYSVTMDSTRSGRQVYCVVTDKYGNSVKSKTVTLSMGNPAKITKQPASVTVANGSKATANLTATGDGLTYKWYFKNPDSNKFSYTSSFKSSSYSVTMDTTRSGRQVYCIVTDNYGSSVQSNTVTLGMTTPLEITTQPVNVTAASGSKATVSVKAVGDGLTYKWYFKNPGSNKFSYTSSFKSSSYSVTMDSTRSGRQVYCIVTDKYNNSVQSDTVTLEMK